MSSAGMETKIIGILGGVGPEATVDLIQKIRTECARQGFNEKDLRLIVYSNPKIEDRTGAVLGLNPSPTPKLTETASKLSTLGADYIIVPCNSVHHFLPEVRKHTLTPFLDMIELTADEVAGKGFKSVLVLATTGTIKTRLYQNALQKRDVEPITPPPEEQEKIMQTIYDKDRGVKAGNLGGWPSTELTRIARELGHDQGIPACIAGCTEIPLVLKQENLPPSFSVIDPARILAREAVQAAFGKKSLSDEREGPGRVDTPPEVSYSEQLVAAYSKDIGLLQRFLSSLIKNTIEVKGVTRDQDHIRALLTGNITAAKEKLAGVGADMILDLDLKKLSLDELDKLTRECVEEIVDG